LGSECNESGDSSKVELHDYMTIDIE
jgi:hypothetical protein